MLRPASFPAGGFRRVRTSVGRLFAAMAVVLGLLLPAAAQSSRPVVPERTHSPGGFSQAPAPASSAGSVSQLAWPARKQANLQTSAEPEGTADHAVQGHNAPVRSVSTPRRLSRRGVQPGPATGPVSPSPPPVKGTDWKKNLSTVAGALGIVLGGFVLLVVLLRQFQPPGTRLLPRDAFEVLGRAPLGGKHFLVLIRLGTKAALLSVRGEEVQTVLEIDDPDQVAHLAGLCQQGRQESATAAFRRTLQELAADPAVANPEYRSSASSGR